MSEWSGAAAPGPERSGGKASPEGAAERANHQAPGEPLPGAVGVSNLTVYDSPAPDGLIGGSPHLHLCCAEAYVVVAGAGEVQTLTLAEGFRETPLRPGAVVWFPPGTIHRLVNRGGLRISVIMQNSGLPEAGDAVLTFPSPVVADPSAYAAAAALPPGGDLSAAWARRDLAVTGFGMLRSAASRGDLEPLREFHRAAGRIVAPRLDSWEKVWRDGPLRVAERTGAHLAALAAGNVGHLADARVYALPDPVEHDRHGMCGLLDTYPVGLVAR